jgi:FkbM family methyltransferase
MKNQSYHLIIPLKTQVLNSFRRLFILSGFDRVLANFTRNNKMNSLPAKLIPANYLYPSGSTRTCVNNGVNFNVDISEYNGHAVYFGLREPATQKLFSLIKPGMVVYDIGANIGVITLNIAKRIQPRGKVFSFEPDPYNFKCAQANINRNNFSKIKLLNLGLGDEKTTAFLYNVNPNNRGMQRLLQSNSNKEFEKTQVQIDTLDNTAQIFSMPAPSLMKIDVEGFELKVLKGATHIIDEYKPLLFIELDDNNLREQGNTAYELVKFLMQKGYNITNATSGNKINQQTDFTNFHFDVLCIAES